MTDQERPEPKPEAPKPSPPPEPESVTDHTVQIGRAAVSYRAVASATTLRSEAGEPRASIFSIAYTRTDTDGQTARPLTFVFNGGPGSSSTWLHLGLVGPRRIDVGDDTTPPLPPYQLVDNDASLLDESDLVFIDPVSTGYSRAAEGQDVKQFHGFREDLESVGEFIRVYTTRTGRWKSPKFLVGESYGTTRAAGLAHHLQERHGMYLSGVGLISAILFFQASEPAPGNDLPYVLALPTYAATARYHGCLEPSPASLQEFASEVEDFAFGEYATLLLQGSRASAEARESVLERLSSYTGLSRTFLDEADLRVAPGRFFKELLRSRRRTVGRLDTRFTGIDADAAGEMPEYDPSYAIIQPPFTAGVNAYIRGELGFESDLPYEVLNPERVKPWTLADDATNKYLDVASMLRQAMSRNRDLKVLLASGYYDMATTFAAAEWTLDHMRIDPSLRGNVRKTRYEAGHMMYIHPPSRQRLAEELRALVRAERAPSA